MGLSTAGVGEPAALTGPGRGQANATPSGRCSDQGRPANERTWIRASGPRSWPIGCHPSTFASGRWPALPANLDGRRPTCKGHAVAYSLYAAAGHPHT